MIFPEGFLPLVELVDECLADNMRMHEAQAPFDDGNPNASHRDWVNWIDEVSFSEGIQSAWGFCDRDDAIPYTMLTNGSVVRISQKLMRNWGIDPVGTFVDITVGTLGSGSGHYDWNSFIEADQHVDHEHIQEHIGPFVGLPVIYREKVARDFLAQLGKWEGSPRAPNHAQVAQAIVDAFDDDKRMTKRDAKLRFAPLMKEAEFLATWQLAASQRPDLSKPGPKKMK